MATTVTIRDETATGKATQEWTLELMSARMTVRDLIRSRVEEEVRAYNRKKAGEFKGLVQPKTGYRESARQIDPEQQVKKALHAFDSNGFLLLVDDRQVESLDDTLELGVDTKLSFVRLVPLVGG